MSNVTVTSDVVPDITVTETEIALTYANGVGYVDASRLRGRLIDSTAPIDGQVLAWDAASSKWIPTTGGAGITDHGLLDAPSLLDDDHPQYILADGTRSFTGSASFDASLNMPIESISTNTTLDDTHYTVIVDTSGGDVTITLPAASASSGRIYTAIKNSGMNDLFIVPNGIDTINGSASIDVLGKWESVRLQCDGSGWFIPGSATDYPLTKAYYFNGRQLGTGTFYVGGHYRYNAASSTLTNAGASVSFGSANNPYSDHVFIVAAGSATVNSGVVGLRVVGTTWTDAGTRTPANSVVLSSDITTLSANEYLETSEKFIGEVSIELFTVSGSPTVYSCAINIGGAKYYDVNNSRFSVVSVDMTGFANATDTNFDFKVLHHKTTGWTYSAGSFAPPAANVITSSATDLSTESDLISGQAFAYKKTALDVHVNGAGDEGIIMSLDVGTNNSVGYANILLGVRARHGD